MKIDFPIIETKNHLLLRIKVKTGAYKSEVVGIVEGRLLITLKAKPIKGKANIEVIETLSSFFHIAKSYIVLQKGFSSSYKEVALLTNQIDSIRNQLRLCPNIVQ